jgi:hypothetical protein
MEVARRTSHLSDLARPLERVVDLLNTCSAVRLVRYRQIEDLVEIFDDLDEGPGLEPVQPESIPPSHDSASWALRDMRVRATPHAGGVLIDGGEAILLYGGTAIHLAGIGLTVWEAATAGCALDELVDAVVAVHGAHPEAQALVTDAADALRAARVIAWAPPVDVDTYRKEAQTQGATSVIEAAGFTVPGPT